MFARVSSAIAALLWLAMVAPASAANLLTNGSFESGTLAGWTLAGTASCAGAAQQAGDLHPGVNGSAITAPTPTDGSWLATLDTSGPNQTCDLYQDVGVPGGVAVTLTYALGVDFNNPSVAAGGVAFTIETTGGSVLQTLYTRAPGSGDQSLAPRTPVDLTPYAGQTIRLKLRLTVGSEVIVPFLDNVVVEIPSNPSFEAGTLANWTTSGTASCAFAAQQQGDIHPGVNGSTVTAPAPTDGVWLGAIDSNGPSQTCEISREVLVPAGAQRTLALDVGIAFVGANGQVDVTVETLGGAPIGTLFSRSGSAGSVPLARRQIDLNAYAGQTLRLRVIDQVAGDPTIVYLDNLRFSLTATAVPTLGQWALVAMAILLGACGAAMARRRTSAV